MQPVKVPLGPPRLKGGRPSDFRPELYASTVQVRQFTKQIRRLRCLLRAREAIRDQRGKPGLLGNTRALWQACVRSTGFRPCFPKWIQGQGFTWSCAEPDDNWLSGVIQHLEECTNQLARATAAAKSAHFACVVEDSWAAGGSLPFRLVKEPQAPAVTELAMRTEVRLAPQKWSPYGKAWIELRNAESFRAGDRLVGSVDVQVLEVRAPYVRLSRGVTRRAAASLAKEWIEADPDVWCPHLLSKWNAFWQRDQGDTIPPKALPYIEALEKVPPCDYRPLDYEDWCAAIKTTKSRSMKGADGWSFSDLRLLPKASVQVLLSLFALIEVDQQWPKLLKTWLVVLLRKKPEGVVPCTQVRPISVVSTLYRMWAKMRTKQFLRHARSLASDLVSPCLSTRSIWSVQIWGCLWACGGYHQGL